MKREYLILALSTAVSLTIAYFVIRALEPRLFGLPVDLKITQSSEKLPPFFEGVFREAQGREGEDFLINDPETIIRGKSFYPEISGTGPHDALGFRNESLPWRADLVILGDSQTYGIGVPYARSWPALLKQALPSFQGVYSAALGGFSVAQFEYLFSKLRALRPQQVLVAVYTGNDLLETFRAVYSLKRFKELRRDGFSLEDLPAIQFPPPPESYEKAEFQNGYSTIFTPKLRYSAVSSSERSVPEAVRLTKELLSLIVQQAKAQSVKPFLTVIPTKEYLLRERVASEQLSLGNTYRDLVQEEAGLIKQLSEAGQELGFSYIAVDAPLTEAAKRGAAIYKTNDDGHLNPAGHKLISEIVAFNLEPAAVKLPDGAYKLQDGSAVLYVEKRREVMFILKNEELLTARGIQLDKLKTIPANLFYRYPIGGTIDS